MQPAITNQCGKLSCPAEDGRPLRRATWRGVGPAPAPNPKATPSVPCGSLPVSRAYADATQRVEFIDCGSVFIKGSKIDAKLMADAIHPTAAGWDKLAACMAPTVTQLMAY